MLVPFFLPILQIIFQVTAETTDPCLTKDELPHLNERIVGYKLNANETPICDYYLDEKWFSLIEKYIIANTSETCGTTTNWYIKDPLPNNGKQEVEVCRYGGYQNSCSEKKTIQVKKCNKGYVFHLTPLDGCSEAYCIQPLDGSMKKGSGPPDISGIDPVVKVEVVKKNKVSLEFYCDIVPPDKTYYQYVVEWSLFTGTSITRSIYSTAPTRHISKEDFRRTTTLKEHHLKTNNINTPGFTLGCTVKARNGSDGTFSHSKPSPPSFFGLEVVNISTVRVKDDETKTIFLKLTIPFGCPNGDCYLDFNTFLPKTPNSCLLHKVVQIAHEGVFCGVRFYRDDYKNGILKPFTITGAFGKSQAMSHDLVYDVVFQTGAKHDHGFFAFYRAASVRVELDINQTKLNNVECSSRSDPHMLTFDGVPYDNQRDGTFIMYRHKELQVEVQTKTKLCAIYAHGNWHPRCNCAVAVRAGKDIFILDLCDETKYISGDFPICEDGILTRHVKRYQNNHKIFLPSGGIVILETVQNFINVHIKPSLVDFNNTEGLCGSFDGNKNNDMEIRPNSHAKDHSISWLVNELAGENLFDKNNYQKLHNWKESRYLCHCVRDRNVDPILQLNPAVVCDSTKRVLCPEDRELDTIKHSCDMTINTRSKRSAGKPLSDHYKDPATNYFPTKSHNNYEPMREAHSKRKIRSVYNDVTARADCLKMMNTTTFKMCKKIPGLNVDSFIEDCVADAVISNSMDWTMMQLEGIKSKCIYHVDVMQPVPQAELVGLLPSAGNETNTTQTENDVNSTTMVPIATQSNVHGGSEVFSISAELLDSLKSISCPNECSGHGQCINGSCNCDVPFTNFDCSINSTKPPVMLGIPDKGKCDLNERKCAETSVIGRNFAETKSLKCRLVPFTIDRYNNLDVSDTIEISAYYETMFEVYCPLVHERIKRSTKTAGITDDFVSRGFRVSVSNDGNEFSDEDSIVVFDSLCVDCSKNQGKILCTTKNGFCMKGGKCFRPEDKEGCQICKAGTLGHSYWEEGPECPKPVGNEDDGKLWIIGVVLGPFALIVILAVAVMCYLSKRGRASNQKIGSMADIN